MRSRGLHPDLIERALMAVNQDECDPPLPEDEVCGIAHGMARYALGTGHASIRLLTEAHLQQMDPPTWLVGNLLAADACWLLRAIVYHVAGPPTSSQGVRARVFYTMSPPAVAPKAGS